MEFSVLTEKIWGGDGEFFLRYNIAYRVLRVSFHLSHDTDNIKLAL